jgi:prepilin-type N-terminal cleavage/methylation domain-containing protein
MVTSRARDSGFSVVEVLVALAIASIAVIILGGLFQLAVRVSDTLATSKSVHTALLDLQGVLQLLGDDFDAEIQRPATAGFIIASASAGELAHLELNAAGTGLALNFVRPTNPGRVDLAVFEEARLEYFERTGPEMFEWVETVRSPNSAFGARLRLSLSGRVWRPLLWMVPSVHADRNAAS